MAETDRVCKFRKVYDDEILEEIIPRRHAARVGDPELNSEQAAKETRESLVGLALSGGGIRAAAFGLGVLQALHQKKLMRHVDYLSTVSGGGYTGSFFSSLVNHPEGSCVWKSSQISKSDTSASSESKETTSKPESADSKTQSAALVDSPYTLESGEGGKQPAMVRTLGTSGPVLRRPVWFASAYFFGLLLTNLVAISGLLAAGALLAFFFQELTEPRVSTFISALGFNDDVKLAFFPAFVLTLLWVTCMLVGNAVQALDFLVRVARGLFVMLVVSIAMAVVVLIGSGNIDVRTIGKSVGLSADNNLISTSTNGRAVSIILLIIALVPYLRVKELVRSGVRPRGFKDRWIFAIASRALLYGVPLLIFGWFAAENFSRFNDEREILVDELKFSKSNMLYPSFFGDGWETFWLTAETSAKSKSTEGKANSDGSENRDRNFVTLRRQVDRCLWQIANVDPTELEKGRENSISDARAILLAPTAAPMPVPDSLWLLLMGDDHSKLFQQLTTLAGKAPDEKNNETSIIDEEQDLQAELEEYDNRYILEKWSFLVSLPSKGNALARQFDERMKERERDNAICDRINYRFLSNPFVAALILKKLLPELEALSKDSDPKPAQQLRDTIANLDRSPAGVHVRNLMNARAADGEIPRKEAVDDFFKKFLKWQPLKHRILYYELNGWPDEQTTRKSLIKEISQQLESEKNATHRQRDYEAIEAGVREFNLACLEKIIYPNQFQPQGTIFASVVLPEDQRARLIFFAWAASICLVAALIVNLNFTSIHSYYQQLMAKVWVKERPGNGDRIPLVQLNNTSIGAPYHLLHGTVSLAPRGRFKPDFPRGGFLFSKRYCGSIDRDFLATAELGNVDLATAMSVSGAAITPSAVDNQLVWAIMFLCNLRTGQWLAWPSSVTTRFTSALYRFAQWMPGMAWHVALNACLPPSWRTMTFVYDGGLYENLGVEPLLARRCRLVIAVDAAEDNQARFADFQLLVQRCRSRYGVTIKALDPDDDGKVNDVWMDPVSPLWSKAKDNDPEKRRFEQRFAKQGVMIFRITYPSRSGLDLPPLEEDKREGTLIYIKPTLTKRAIPDIIGYAQAETEFPQDATLNQFYEPRQFDAYRTLGESLGEEAIAQLESRAGTLPGVETYWKSAGEASAAAGQGRPGAEPAEASAKSQTTTTTGPEVGKESPDAQPPADEAASTTRKADVWEDVLGQHWLDKVIRTALEADSDPTRIAKKVLLLLSASLRTTPKKLESRFLPPVRKEIEESAGQSIELRAQRIRLALARYLSEENP